jgi:acetate kinase
VRILVVNAGSTSLKLACVDEGTTVSDVASLEDVPRDVDAVGHRVVHGGAHFRGPALIDDAVLDALRDVTQLAPLHNAPALAAIEQARRRLPVPHVAVFDSAFHSTLPPESSTYPLPRKWREEWGIRRYGFHGLSVQWAAEQVRVSRLVVTHLGGGCSVTAVLDGRSIDTTMGFTPLEGVPMATRSGSIDPGAIFHVLRSRALSADEIDHALEHEAGLLGLSGRSGRVDELERLERSGDEAARLALAVFARRVAQAVAAMATSLGGLDALVFTAGIGEHSAPMRERIAAQLAFLGVEVDHVANEAVTGDSDIASEQSRVRVVVVRAREELVIARAAAATI